MLAPQLSSDAPSSLRLRPTRTRSVLLTGALVLALAIVFAGGALRSAAQAEVTPPSVNQCNGTDNVGGQAVECTVTVTNNLDLATGETSSSTEVKECHGFANAALTCVTTTTPSDQLVTSVTQCDGSGNGGGGTVTCSVAVVNNITGVASTSPATVDQCNVAGTGGGIEPTVLCDPFPASTTNATVTQCNEAGTGGGGTLRVRCDVTTSTQTSALPVTVHQCVGSGNGGGGYVTCRVSLTNNIIPAEDTTPDTTTPDTTTPVDTTPDTTTPVDTTPDVTVPVDTTTPVDTNTPAGTPGVPTPGITTRQITTAAVTPPAANPPAATPPAITTAAKPPVTNQPTTPNLPRTGSQATSILMMGALALLLGSGLLVLSQVQSSSTRRNAGL